MSATACDLAYKQFEALIREVFLRHGLPVERCSDLLFSQLAYMPLYPGLNYPFQFVEREVSHLEGLQLSNTKAAEPFSDKGPLSGFMHKHFYVQGYEHLGINARLAWKLDKPHSGKLPQLIRQISKKYKARNGETALQELSAELAREFVYGTNGVFALLSGKATGNWIVYLPYKCKNYYLCIAKHHEDDFIVDALKQCVAQFSFVAEVLRDTARQTP